MHVHELNPKKTLVVVIIFMLIIIVGFITLKNPRFTYKLSLQQSIQLLHNKEACFQPYQLANVLNKVNGDVVLIDIRNKFAFGQGHIPGAENISAYDLTDSKNMEHLNELKDKNMTVVLYGNNQLQANGPWMWFRQVGFDNVKILLGGYDYYKTHKDNLAQTKKDSSYLKGIARYDYAKVAGSVAVTNNSQKIPEKKPVIVRRKKKVAAASGGC